MQKQPYVKGDFAEMQIPIVKRSKKSEESPLKHTQAIFMDNFFKLI